MPSRGSHCKFCLHGQSLRDWEAVKTGRTKFFSMAYTRFCETVTTTKSTLCKDKGDPLHVEHL